MIPWSDRLFHCPRHDLSKVCSARICAEPFEMWNRLAMTWWHQTLMWVPVKLACLNKIRHVIQSSIRCKSNQNCIVLLQFVILMQHFEDNVLYNFRIENDNESMFCEVIHYSNIELFRCDKTIQWQPATWFSSATLYHLHILHNSSPT